MKPYSKKREPKGHTSMSRPHPNRDNKLRPDKKAARDWTDSVDQEIMDMTLDEYLKSQDREQVIKQENEVIARLNDLSSMKERIRQAKEKK